MVLGFCITVIMVGCGTTGGNDDEGVRGTSTIQGNISSFETTDVTFVPVKHEKEGFLARFVSGISEVLVPAAYARGVLEGITVYLEGPVSRSTTTTADGIFIFTELPAGTYQLRFEYSGEEVRYRGNSGQVPAITVEEDQTVELISIRISGGRVNIGNIKRLRIRNQIRQTKTIKSKEEE